MKRRGKNHKITTIRHNVVTKPTPSKFGEDLLAARTKLLLTQPELSDRTKTKVSGGIHYNTIYNIETGRTAGSLKACRVLKETIDDLHVDKFHCSYPWDGNALTITRDNLLKFIRDSEVENAITHEIALATKLKVLPADSFIDLLIERMPAARLKTIPEVEAGLKKRQELITRFGICCLRNPALRPSFVSRGIGVSSLQVMLVLEHGSLAELIQFLRKFSPDKTNPSSRARHMKAAYDVAHKKRPSS